VRRAAWEYIKFMGSAEAEKIKVETLVDMGLANQVNPILLRRYGFDAYLRLVPEGVEEAFQESLKNGHPEPYGKNCNLIYTEMTYPLDQILLSQRIRSLWDEGRIDEAKGVMKGILERAVVKTNERMLGHVPPEAMKIRRIVAFVVAVAIFGGFIWLGIHVWQVFSKASRMMSQPVVSKGMLPWICLAPAAILTLMWNYLPLARGTGMAFQDYQLILPSTFVGLDNFANVLFDAAFWNSMVATLHFAAWTLTAGFFTPILLAYALHLIPRHKIIFRVIYYLPAVVSAAAVFFLWRELFGADSILNQMLRLMGFEAKRAWTEDPHLAMLSCVIPGIWAGAGPGCLIYLAALKTIPVEQFEAAEIDGASFLDKTRLIVCPGLKGLIIINFTGAIAAAFHGATNILIMTGGGPNGATEVSSLLLFFEAFTRLRFGHATAMAWIIGSMLIGITVLQLQRLSSMEFKTVK
jgi:multiple sugar transport system permease protein